MKKVVVFKKAKIAIFLNISPIFAPKITSHVLVGKSRSVGLVHRQLPGGDHRADQLECAVYRGAGGHKESRGLSHRGNTGQLARKRLYLGRIGKWEWIEKWFKVQPEKLEQQKEKVDRYGIWLALLAWVPIAGDIITLALGFYKAKPFGTMALLLIGKFLRFLVWNIVIGVL